MNNFRKDYPDYPCTDNNIQVEAYVVSDSDVPDGNGGINGEEYTYAELRHHPIIPELDSKINHPTVKRYVDECNRRNRVDGFKMYRVNGEYCFWGLRLGPIVKAPTLEELRKILAQKTATATALRNKTVSTDMIRDITYNLLREAIANECNMTITEAGSVIGYMLDCAPHEDEATGLVFMVPNWAHRWFRHNGYASHMCKLLNMGVL